jgi:hypothetical protein
MGTQRKRGKDQVLSINPSLASSVARRHPFLALVFRRALVSTATATRSGRSLRAESALSVA